MRYALHMLVSTCPLSFKRRQKECQEEAKSLLWQGSRAEAATALPGAGSEGGWGQAHLLCSAPEHRGLAQVTKGTELPKEHRTQALCSGRRQSSLLYNTVHLSLVRQLLLHILHQLQKLCKENLNLLYANSFNEGS